MMRVGATRIKDLSDSLRLKAAISDQSRDFQYLEDKVLFSLFLFSALDPASCVQAVPATSTQLPAMELGVQEA